jgi:hypothetical protein
MLADSIINLLGKPSSWYLNEQKRERATNNRYYLVAIDYTDLYES